MCSKTSAVALIGAVLIGCVASVSVAAPSDACSLLTQARVSEALGVSVGPGEHIASQSSCQWGQQGKRVTLTITQGTGSQTPVDRFNIGKTPVNGVTKEPANGIGDDAYYVYFTTMTKAIGLVVRKGSFVFEIRVYGLTLEQGKTISKNLAQDVIGKV